MRLLPKDPEELNTALALVSASQNNKISNKELASLFDLPYQHVSNLLCIGLHHSGLKKNNNDYLRDFRVYEKVSTIMPEPPFLEKAQTHFSEPDFMKNVNIHDLPPTNDEKAINYMLCQR